MSWAAKRRELVDRQHQTLSIVRQCALLGVGRSSLYYRPKETSQHLSLMREMDRHHVPSSAKPLSTDPGG